MCTISLLRSWSTLLTLLRQLWLLNPCFSAWFAAVTLASAAVGVDVAAAAAWSMGAFSKRPKARDGAEWRAQEKRSPR
jgi:hypothetical protein